MQTPASHNAGVFYFKKKVSTIFSFLALNAKNIQILTVFSLHK